MKNNIVFLCLLFLSISLLGQKGKDGVGNITGANTIVNTYTSLSLNVSAGANVITVGSSTGFSIGDLIFIIQMQGAKVNAGKDTLFPDLNNSIPMNSTYGAVSNYYTSGNNEFAQIHSIAGNSFTLDCALQKSYQTIGKVQVIRVPRYTSLTITGSITCPQWNGTTGGVAIVEVDGVTTLSAAGSFNVIGKGFRGGGRENSTVFGATKWGSVYPGEGGYKGESIAGDTNTYRTLFSGVFGKGAIANGGGGGNGVNAGGGGGANGGLTGSWTGNGNPITGFATAWNLEGAGFATSTSSGGGRGGYTFSNNNSNVTTTAPGSGTWAGDNRRIQGGLGGRPLDYSTGRLFLGGGGGSGDEENNFAAPTNTASGGNGGGLVYLLSYGNVTGTGTILADGANGSNTRNDGSTCSGKDGAGGGGGGGTVVINSTASISLTAATAISAKGGNGGNATLYNNCTNTLFNSEANDGYGPGGGGGGGYVAITSGTAVSNVSGGNNGILTGNASNIAANFPPNGATIGGNGTSTTINNFFLTVAPATICSGQSTTLTAVLNGTVPTPTPSINWYSVTTGGTPISTGTTFTTGTLSNTTTFYVETCPGFYRVPVTVTVTGSLAVPTINSPVNYCQNQTAVSLSATAGSGNNLLWWGTNSTGGTSSSTANVPSTSTVGTFTYYVSQSSGSCESPRAAITVNVNANPSAPSVNTPVVYCQNETANALSATAGSGNNLLWWGTSSTGGTSTGTATVPSTSTSGTFTYYVSQSNSSCESPRASITVTINPTPAAPLVSSPVTYCQNETATALNASSLSGASLLWWGTSAIGGTSSVNAPTPSTTTIGTFTYYVSQVSGNCESPRVAISVNVSASPSAPLVTSPVNYCQNATASILSATAGSGNTLQWWGTSASGGTSSVTASIPSTTNVGVFTYYVSQVLGTCESPRAAITVNINTVPSAPNVNTPISYCQNEPASPLIANAASGNNLLWWGTNATGGTSSSLPTTPSTTTTGNFTYYVSETNGNCESSRIPIVVNVLAIPSTPVVTSPVNYCQNESAIALSATASTGNNLLWWGTNSTGGVSSGSPTIPTTAIVGSVTYYVSETNGNCESPRQPITVNINAIPSVPLVNSPISYCENEIALPLSATAGSGNNLLWWGTSASGGISTGSAAVPSTANSGTFNYYVSETNGNCESPRAIIVVNINPIPAAPLGSDTTYCQNQVPTQLSAIGSGTINWYNVAVGGTASTTSPTPTTSTVGIFNFYASQTLMNCESLRDTLTITIVPSFSAPIVNNISYCQGENAQALTATSPGTLNWYLNPTGGTPSSNSPIPSTSTPGTTSFYVSAGTGTCESPRSQLDVTVNPIPTSPAVTSPVSYCQNGIANPLTAISTGSLNWYGTNSTGGTPSPNPNTPSTSTVGSQYYYVSQTITSCESPRDSILVIINSIPLPPAGNDIAYCQNTVASPLTATGIGTLNWYSNFPGIGSSISPTPNTNNLGTTDYFVTQTINGCESDPDTISVTVNTSFSAPLTSNLVYCQNDISSPLTASGTGQLNWYTSSVGGSSSVIAPTPSTSVAGVFSFFVSQGTGACESSRAQIDVTVNPRPLPPITQNLQFCINENAAALTANGINLTWYLSIGGPGSQLSPTPNTSVIGTFDYFVTQTINSCESDFDTLTVVVTGLQTSPIGNDVVYCQGSIANALSASGNSLNWWSSAVGGVSSNQAPIPSTQTAGTFNFFVSQGTGACESLRDTITVTVNPTPSVLFGVSSSTVCLGECVQFAEFTSGSCQSISWDFGDGSQSNSSAPTHCYESSGSFNVQVTCTNSFGCSGTSTINNSITVLPSAVADFTINEGNIVSPSTVVSFLADTNSVNGQTYNWNFGDPLSGNLNSSSLSSTFHLYADTGIFCIRLIASIPGASCPDTVTKCLEVVGESTIEIPNIFTPNNDGINEVFSIKSYGLSNLSAVIFDRWGKKVTEWDGVSGFWDGKIGSGKLASSGVYYYIIKATNLKKEIKEYSGFLQLINNE